MDARDKQDLLDSLNCGRSALLDAVAGFTDEAAARRPGEGQWSVLECLEHVAMAEEFLLSQTLLSQPCGTRIDPSREARIRERGADGTRRVSAPEGSVPSGECAGIEAAIARFLAARERTIEFVENCTDDLRARVTTHPVIGEVNCYENLLMVALHPQRHAKQIEEIRAALIHDV